MEIKQENDIEVKKRSIGKTILIGLVIGLIVIGITYAIVTFLL